MAGGLVFAVLLMLQSGQPPAPADSSLPVSVDRIREALSRPPALDLRRPRPDFVVEVNERQRFARMIAPFLQFDAGAVKKPAFFAPQPQVGTTPALASVDLLSIASALRHQLSATRTARASSSAQDAVRKAIAEYCAAQPNGGTALRICMDPASIR